MFQRIFQTIIGNIDDLEINYQIQPIQQLQIAQPEQLVQPIQPVQPVQLVVENIVQQEQVLQNNQVPNINIIQNIIPQEPDNMIVDNMNVDNAENAQNQNQVQAYNVQNEINMLRDLFANNAVIAQLPDSNEFKHSKGGKNIIKNITPKDSENANFDKTKYPNELYSVEYLDGSIEDKPALDINEYTLDVKKTVYKHNLDMVNKLTKNGNHIQPESKNVVIYTRSSKGNITLTQKQICLKYASDNNMLLNETYGYIEDNNVSGRTNITKGEIAFWMNHISPNSIILVYSADRLTRNMLNGLQFLNNMVKNNISIHFIKEEIIYNDAISASKKSVIHHALSSAEEYSNITSEKIKTTFQRLKSEGHIFGTAPYGYKIVKNANNVRIRITNNNERDIIDKIKRKYIETTNDFENLRENSNIRKTKLSVIKSVIRWCNRENYKNRKHTAFTVRQILTIIKS